MTGSAYLAFDLGAESGRAVLGELDAGRLRMTEVHRFANGPCPLPAGGLHWNLLDIWANIVEGLALAGRHVRDNGLELAGMGVDTWGVDFALLGPSGQLVGMPWCYRAERNIPAMELAVETLGEERLYDATGCQLLPINTLIQLLALKTHQPELLAAADRMLMIPDLLHYFLTGRAINEASAASTTQMLDPRSRPAGAWATDLLSELDLPTGIMGEIIQPGQELGTLRAELAGQVGLGKVKVIAPASHDTASAIAAVPAGASDNWCYISSGTWSLMGVELDGPIISPAARSAGFTNEGGVGGTIRFLKNITGLWLVQQVRADLASRGRRLDYAELTELAGKAPALRTLVDPFHQPLLLPGDMIGKLAAYARSTGQDAPADVGAQVRCCLESLAMCYRRTLEQLEQVTGRAIEVIHVVGGGGRNKLLNQMTADATGRAVLAGPFEGTAAGNLLVQAMGDGKVSDLAHIRRIVADSVQVQAFAPADASGWDEAYERFKHLVALKA